MNLFPFVVLFASLLAQVLGNTEDNYFEEFIPASFVEISNQTFYIGVKTVKLELIEATRICNDFGMKLVSFQTEEKWLEIGDYMTENGPASSNTSVSGYGGFEYWTSGTSNRAYVWSATGEAIKYFDWDEEAGEPSANVNKPDFCISFYCDKGWYESNCDVPYSVMCE